MFNQSVQGNPRLGANLILEFGISAHIRSPKSSNDHPATNAYTEDNYRRKYYAGTTSASTPSDASPLKHRSSGVRGPMQ